MKQEHSETTDRLISMVGELDLTHQVEAGRFLNNLLKVQRAQNRAERKANAAIAVLRKTDPDTADQLKDGNCQCSFCKKWEGDVQYLIASPYGAYICNECVALCVEVLQEIEEEEKEKK